jgi:hypothetical protein
MPRAVPEIDSVASVFHPPCAKSLISQALWHGANQAGLAVRIHAMDLSRQAARVLDAGL